MKVAVGTSLATIIVTSVSSVRAHHRRGAVDFSLLKSWGPWIFIGVLIGTAVASVVRGPVLTGVFATVALVVRSEEHTSELQSLMRISYAVFCLKKTN